MNGVRGLEVPASPFPVARIFHVGDGWYVRMRPGDGRSLGMQRVVPWRVDPIEGTLVGPFSDRRRLERWFDRFVDTYGTHRARPGELPEMILGKYRACPPLHPHTPVSSPSETARVSA